MLYWRQMVVQHHINKEMCTVLVSVVKRLTLYKGPNRIGVSLTSPHLTSRRNQMQFLKRCFLAISNFGWWTKFTNLVILSVCNVCIILCNPCTYGWITRILYIEPSVKKKWLWLNSVAWRAKSRDLPGKSCSTAVSNFVSHHYKPLNEINLWKMVG
jgi:hypothetical protein